MWRLEEASYRSTNLSERYQQVSVGTSGCLGFPCLLIVMNLLVPCDFKAVEVNCGQRAAALRGCILHTRMLFITATNTVDSVGSVDMQAHIKNTYYMASVP